MTIPFLEFFGEHLTWGDWKGKGERNARCPFHDDLTPSMSVNVEKGVWFCHACGAKGNAIQFYARLKGVSLEQATDFLEQTYGEGSNGGSDTFPDGEAEVARRHEKLLAIPEKVEFLTKECGWTPDTIRRFQIGWDGIRFNIPIRDEDRRVVNIRRYDPGASGKNKVLSTPGHGRARLWPPESLSAEHVILCEGEKDAILACQLGLAAVTATAGAGTWDDDWGTLFRGKIVSVCYDIDEAGRAGSEKVLRSILPFVEEARNVLLPLDPKEFPKGDFTDYIVRRNYTRQDFENLCRMPEFKVERKKKETAPSRDDQEYATTLDSAVKSQYVGRVVVCAAIVVAKDIAPYLVPSKVRVVCPNERCSVCPFQEKEQTIEIPADSEPVLGLVEVSRDRKRAVLRRALGVPGAKTCPGAVLEEVESRNVEEMKLIPAFSDVDWAKMEAADSNVMRPSYYAGYGLVPNSTYDLKARLFAHPNDQHTTLLVFSASAAKDDLSRFMLEDADIAALQRLFKDGLDPVYDDLVANVTRIYRRRDMHLFIDLVFHSVLAIPWRGRPERGYLDALLIGDSRQGKAQPLDAKVLTPTGWVEMGNLKVGDSVCHPRGGASFVTGVFPQGMKDVYCVKTRDGAVTECCGDHLWTVNTSQRKRSGGPFRTLPLHEIQANLKDPRGGNRNFIPISGPVQFAHSLRPLPIDPYLLGLLLGDGTFAKGRGVGFSSADAEIIAAAVTLLRPLGACLRNVSKYDWQVRGLRSGVNPTRRILADLGLAGLTSSGKFVPEIFKLGSVAERLSLLQGLLDTDGTVTKPDQHKIVFTSVSERLARDVVFLARSLGGTTTIFKRETSYSYKGEKRKGTPAFIVCINPPVGVALFRLSRKLERISTFHKHPPQRGISSIVPAGRKECRCISVSAQDGLYITDDFIVTHNTETSTKLAKHYGVGERVVCKTVTRAGLLGGLTETARRWWVSWGKAVTSDRRLLILEEVKGMPVEVIAALTDARSSGVAEVTGIERQRAWARTRLLWISNPREDRAMSTFSYGVEAVKALVGAPEDIARFDMAMAVASGEVSDDFLNLSRAEMPAADQRATPDLCRKLVLWAWSRRLEQIEVTEEAEAAILAAAKAMGRVYSARIPLAEPADLRLKLLRLATAYAARIFSSPDGERLVVRAPHVQAVMEFLDHIYGGAIGYRQFSETQHRIASIEEPKAVLERLQSLQKWSSLRTHLLAHEFFAQDSLGHAAALDKIELKEIMDLLVSSRCLERRKRGYCKSPSFTALLKGGMAEGVRKRSS